MWNYSTDVFEDSSPRNVFKNKQTKKVFFFLKILWCKERTKGF